MLMLLLLGEKSLGNRNAAGLSLIDSIVNSCTLGPVSFLSVLYCYIAILLYCYNTLYCSVSRSLFPNCIFAM